MGSPGRCWERLEALEGTGIGQSPTIATATKSKLWMGSTESKLSYTIIELS